MPRSWDAESYHRISTPQQAMAREVLDRLPLEGNETVLDAGCGSGIVTAMLLDRLPRGRVVAVDASTDMVAKAREHLADRAERVDVVVADLTELEVDEAVDAIVSTATFHWIADHDALFGRLVGCLRPAGRLVAQWGGEGNLDRARGLVAGVAMQDRYLRYLEGWKAPWHYVGAEETEERLVRAGFEDVRCWLQRFPVTPEHPEEFFRTVLAAPLLERFPAGEHEPFLAECVDAFGGDFELDYVRLNADATRRTRR